ncbi:MAG: ATP-binding cassette domain-containing protein [Kiritimatiellia bacterium]
MSEKRKRPVLELKDVSIVYKTRRRPAVRAVSSVSFSLRRGSSFGIVGESGCGKTSLARAIIGLKMPEEGKLFFEGKNPAEFSFAEYAEYRRKVQMIFQDAAGSLNPRMTTRQTLTEVLKVHRMCRRDELRKQIGNLLDLVALPERLLDVYPREMSGGQCQRVSIARCLALEPELIIADEPVSALDVSVQARILNLLKKLRHELNLAIILISHDLAVVRHICDHVAVMHRGIFVERGITAEIMRHPQHPYTKKLLSAVPDVKSGLEARMSTGVRDEL